MNELWDFRLMGIQHFAMKHVVELVTETGHLVGHGSSFDHSKFQWMFCEEPVRNTDERGGFTWGSTNTLNSKQHTI